MALLIDSSCINCDMCEPECPNQAIRFGEQIYQIDSNLCTECVGHYDAATCIEVCPLDCISVDPNRVEDKQTLLAKFKYLYHLA